MTTEIISLLFVYIWSFSLKTKKKTHNSSCNCTKELIATRGEPSYLNDLNSSH